MRFTSKLFAGLAAGAILLVAHNVYSADEAKASDEPKPDKEGYYSLFDGKTLDGWKVGNNAASWKAEDGVIEVHGPGPSHIFYVGPVHNHDWKNFHLKAMVMTFPHANSGIYFHTKYQKAGWPDDGFEAQVNATHSDWKKTGSLYDVKDIRDPHHVDNKWFEYDIIVEGKHVVLKIDGTTVCDWTEPEGFKPPKGHPGRYLHHGTFALQGHDPGSKTYFKDIRVKALDD
ncbi:MAG TPA: DUF1080 domain-containing protein [Pirellulales bacterium]|jgi:hypothetical protein|nr:DUF1080 domain-containing protein [Pirellulales bacterium]